MPRTKAREGEPPTPERLRAAAIELFAERGFHGTGIRDIATRAGTTLSSLYHHCGNKDDLLVDIMFTSTEPLLRATEKVRAAIGRPAEQLAMIVEQHVWAHGTDRLAKLVSDTEVRALAGERRDRVIALRDAYEELWQETVADGVRQGAFDVEHPRVVTRALLEMCTAVSHWYQPNGELSLDDLSRLYADRALALMRAAENGRPTFRKDLRLPEPAQFLG
jgi:AcrR family transcriptional regulator